MLMLLGHQMKQEFPPHIMAKAYRLALSSNMFIFPVAIVTSYLSLEFLLAFTWLTLVMLPASCTLTIRTF
jgi:hypothetical protein